jgi:hypothetical protein
LVCRRRLPDLPGLWRRLFALATVPMVLAALLFSGPYAGASTQQDPTIGEPMIATRQFVGVAKRDGAVVRSGPTTGHLAVMTLARDEEVVVVGFDKEFLRVLPPEGTFCMVAKQRVEALGSGAQRTGKITANAPVRAGSKLSGMPGETTATLTVGEQVSIVGEDSMYFHIKPPKNVFFYVDQLELGRSREVVVSETSGGWKVEELDESGNAQQEPVAGAEESPDGVMPLAGEPQAEPTEPEGVVIPDVVIPTTKPAILTEFSELDARYTEAAKLPLEEQPLEELKQEYAAMLEKAQADPGMQTIVSAIQARIDTITLRQEALQDLLAMQAMREQMAKRQQSLEAEQEELAVRAQGAKVTFYAAVGQLRPSTLQVGGGSLFRLCDPANGRTMIYLRAEGDTAKELSKHLERFIGVKGEVANDKELSLRFIKVSAVAAVDPSQLFKGVAADLIPPSLVQNADAAD